MNSAAEIRQNRKKRLAVVEEMASDIYSVQFVLQTLGYTVRSFACQESALQAISEFKPHLILLDMLISGGAAFRFAPHIREVLPDTPLLAIGAETMAGNASDVSSAGCNDLLYKPYSIADLYVKVETLLAGS
jgi:CheY-like chemotaxis protein